MSKKEWRTGEIYVLEDEDQVSGFTLGCELRAAEYDATFFADKEVLYSAIRRRVPVCVCLCHVPIMDLQSILHAIAKYQVPVIVVSREGDIPTAVSAIRAGAVDFIHGHADHQEIVRRIEKAIGEVQEKNRAAPWRQHFPGRPALSLREREVLEQIVIGQSNKQIASLLTISQRTVEDHRRRIKRKMGARSTVELMIAMMREVTH